MDRVNEKKVAFIICVNDEEAFAECAFYLDRLALPPGFEKDVITIWDAPSMTCGYNAAMNSSDAKYKIYLHQDVHIINRFFLRDIQQIFERDPKIGILGCIGTTKLGKEAMAVTSWNTGKVIHNAVPMRMEFEESGEDYVRVEALDGLLLVTQYDIPWREDIMDGWDFYDISQCMEFMRAGYQVVVPRQDRAWCFHDNTSSNMTNYNLYRKKFIEAYAADGSFEMPPVWAGALEYQNMKQQTVQMMEQIVQNGNREQLHKIFQDGKNRAYIHLKEYEALADIDYLEEHVGTKERLWRDGMAVQQILRQIRTLKYWIKRIEHQAADSTEMMRRIMQNYSVYAVVEIFVQYVVYKEYTFEEIKKYFAQEQLVQEMEVWESVMPKRD